MIHIIVMATGHADAIDPKDFDPTKHQKLGGAEPTPEKPTKKGK